MSAPVREACPALTMAAAQLLLAARASTVQAREFTLADADRLLHRGLRYSHRGADGVIVSPAQAVEELIAAGLAFGSSTHWGLA